MSDDLAVICGHIEEALREPLGEAKAKELADLLYDLAIEARSEAVSHVQDLMIPDALIPVKEALAEHRHLSTGEASINLREVIEKWFK